MTGSLLSVLELHTVSLYWRQTKKIGPFSCVVLCQQSNGYPILKYFDSIRQPWQGPLVLFKSFPLQQLNVGGPPTHARPRLASLMTCYGSRDGDCVRSKAALLICCWPQSQALRSTSPRWRFKRGIWEPRGRKHATYQHRAEPYQGSQRDARDQYTEVWCRI